MYDLLPFPHKTRKTVEEQVQELYEYLIQFKETLEFILTNIGVDNLSSDLIAKIDALGNDIARNADAVDEQMQQVANRTLSPTSEEQA